MGGAEALDRFRADGRLDARARIDALLDPGTFREFGRIAGKGRYDAEGRFLDMTPTNAIFGTGRIDGGKVTVSADDFTLRGGSSESTISDKWVYAERMALTMRTPLVRLVDTAGGSVKLLEKMGHSKIPGYPNWPPVVGVALGSCAGLGAIKVLLSHFSVMVRDQAQVFAAGPPVVRQAYGIEIGKDERDAFAQVRRFLSFMPRHAGRLPARVRTGDAPDRLDD
jgi:acetyl-CoA carboxylase carboxyltransferase component